jgi:hypothetical protein
MPNDLIFTHRPRSTFWRKPLHLALVRSGIHVARRGIAIMGWMLCGAFVVAMLGLHYVPRWWEAAIDTACPVVSDPALDALLAAQGMQHANLAQYAQAMQTWRRDKAEGKPLTLEPRRPGNAWRVCEAWVEEPHGH